MPIDEPTSPEDQLPEDDAVAALDETLPEHEIDDADEPDPADFEIEPEFDDSDLSEDAALIARARRRMGTGGAIIAGGMLGLEKILQPKVKQEAPVEWEAPGEPLDIDRKGITVPIDDEAVVRSRPGPPAAPGASARKVTRRRRP
jgi:hypothetical protein